MAGHSVKAIWVAVSKPSRGECGDAWTWALKHTPAGRGPIFSIIPRAMWLLAKANSALLFFSVKGTGAEAGEVIPFPVLRTAHPQLDCLACPLKQIRLVCVYWIILAVILILFLQGLISHSKEHFRKVQKNSDLLSVSIIESSILHV